MYTALQSQKAVSAYCKVSMYYLLASIVSRYRDPQTQEAENTRICKIMTYHIILYQFHRFKTVSLLEINANKNQRNNIIVSIRVLGVNPTSAEICLYKPRDKVCFFQFEIIINVLVDSFRFILIPMLWVYCQYEYVTLPMRGSASDVRF